MSKMLRVLPALVVAGFVLPGCSAVPDWADPFSDSAPEQAEPADGDYPELADIPETPAPAGTVEQRRDIVEGLVADREMAQHSGEQLRGGSAAGAPPVAGPADAVTPIAAAETAPVAAPAAATEISFPAGAATLDEIQLARIEAIGKSLAGRPGIVVKVAGYAGGADVESAEASGSELAMARASAVAQLLAVAGVPAEAILVGVPDPMPELSAEEYRRVTITIE